MTDSKAAGPVQTDTAATYKTLPAPSYPKRGAGASSPQRRQQAADTLVREPLTWALALSILAALAEAGTPLDFGALVWRLRPGFDRRTVVRAVEHLAASGAVELLPAPSGVLVQGHAGEGSRRRDAPTLGTVTRGGVT